MIEMLGYFAAAVGAIVTLLGAHRIAGELALRAAWRWASTRHIVRNVRNGWNAGPPPEGVWVLVANNAAFIRSATRDEGTWAVMMRRENTMFARGGGLTMPVRNVEGWLAIVGERDD